MLVIFLTVLSHYNNTPVFQNDFKHVGLEENAGGTHQ